MNQEIKADTINKSSKFDKTEEGDNIMLCLSKQTSTQTSASLNSTLFDNMTPSKNDANWVKWYQIATWKVISRQKIH